MEYPVLPTLKEFEEYCGEKIEGKLSGDIKDQNELFTLLAKRSYRAIIKSLKGIKKIDLETEDEENWKILIMEQSEYYLSVGDRSLIDNTSDLNQNVIDLAVEFGLWSFNLRY